MLRKIISSVIIIFGIVCVVGCSEKEVQNLDKVHSEASMYQNSESINKVILSNKEENNTIPQLSPKYLGNYFEIDVESDTYFVENSDGKLFGYEESHWDGCSSWCSVWKYYCNISASSTLKSQGKFSYITDNLKDYTRDTAWVEGAEDDGIGEYIEVRQLCQVGDENNKKELQFSEICIVNGYTATIKNWVENNRIRELKMYFNDEYITNIELEDTIKPQYIDITSLNLKVNNGDEAKFKFEIADVYKGEKYRDTAMTGLIIEFNGREGH